MAETSELDGLAAAETNPAPKEDSAKRRQIMDGARKVFMADGFDGASMNDIARAAGVSKGTLYVYFDSKDELFAALIREEKRAQAEQVCELAPNETDLRSALNRFGVSLLNLVLRPESIAHLRIVLAVGAKFPSIGQAFYEAGPKFGRSKLARFFAAQVAEGKLDIDDTARAALYFCEMCKAPYLLEAILGVGTCPSRDEIDHHVAKAVDAFLRLYGKDNV